MRVALYARVSTADKDQNSGTQLLPLREFCGAQGWESVGEFVDTASATDLRGRTAWHSLLEQASKRKLDLILVWKLDRAFRSVAHASVTLQDLKRWGIGLRSYSEPWLDTSGNSPAGELMLNILISFAQFERSLIGERVRAGLSRARRQGVRLGRPRIVVGDRWPGIKAEIQAGTISKREAAKQLGIGRSSVIRLLRQECGVH
ncbi:MAG TPA: recombinase family protein [Blastocatellia bacterium]|nr:recombinase family protein [Blastocatellia bacterium]